MKTKLALSLLLTAATFLTGCAVPLDRPLTGYSCCNLSAEYGWISSNNLQGQPIIPAGEPIAITTIKKSHYLYGSLGNQDVAFRDDNGSGKESAIRWARKLVVSEDPKLQLATWSPDVQTAVRIGKIKVGMTRAQVLMSLGYPAIADTPDLDAMAWRYWTYREDETVDVSFDANGAVSALVGKPFAVQVIEFPH